MDSRPHPRDTIEDLRQQQFAQASSLFLAGSVMRGQGTPHSDLDVVVVFDKLPNAYRQSLFHQGWPVELFVHDPETLAYFCAADRQRGIPSLPAMLAEGLELPESTPLSRRLKAEAKSLLKNGPPAWAPHEIEAARYEISDLCDDLRQPRGHPERIASACRLHPALANFYLRGHNQWSASGKSIPGRLAQVDAEMARRFATAFEQLFSQQEAAALLSLSQQILAPFGGFLFAQPPQHAPPEWRLRPTPRLFTPRLVLRLGEESDIASILDYFRHNQARFITLEPERPDNFLSPAYWGDYLHKARREWSDEQALRLFLFPRQGPKKVVGIINFSQMHRGPFQACTVGYSLDLESEGQGLMSEALQKTVDYVFGTLGYHRIMANYLPENLRSARLLQRLDFKVEGLARNYLHLGGEWRDHVLTSLTRD